jgi:type IV secretory pathway TrbD component
MRKRFTRDQKMTIVYGILCIVLILVILQFWLLTATMNAYLGGDQAIILPAAIASVVCFALNAGLLWYLHGIERS